MGLGLRNLAVDLLGNPIQAAFAAKKPTTVAENVGKLLFDVAEHFCAEWDAVIGEQRIEFGRGEYHILCVRLKIVSNFQSFLSPLSSYFSSERSI